MRQIISTFSLLLVLVLNIFMCITMSSATMQSACAKEFKSDMVAEIENSNFNPKVINACREQAQAAGYELDIRSIQYDENNFMQSAEVLLSYSYKLPLFGIQGTKTTRGIAR